MGVTDVRTEEMLLNMGPQHPSTHGVLRVVLRTDGEIILDCESHIGYLHRCFEKIGESVTYVQVHPYTDRIDYLSAMGCNLSYAIAVEKLLECEVPERAEYIRVIVSELNRIASHLLSFGTYGLDLGAITPFLYAFREREAVLRLLETVCGQRLNYNYIRIGGVAYDLPDGYLKAVSDFVDYFEPRIQEYNDLLTYNGIFIERTRNVGVLTPELAIAYGASGPVLRGSGVKRDLRKDKPYGIYDRLEFEVPVGMGEMGTVGDCWDRYIVRIREMVQSCRIIRQAVAGCPAEGPHMAKLGKVLRPPKGEVYSAVENARGELGFYLISDGGQKAYRLKARSPAYSNLSLLHEIAPGTMVADMVAIIGSLDIVMGEIDR